jgi:uridine phosphorylase
VTEAAADARMSHTLVAPGDVGRYVFLPGSPERAEKIATRFNGARKLAQHREFSTYTGTLDGTAVAVTSTGIGGPSAAIALEELVRCGARTFIRIGSCGSTSARVRKHDVVVVNAAVRMEGTGTNYLPLEFPAVADPRIITALDDAAAELRYPHTIGITICKDAFFAQVDPDSLPYAPDVKHRWAAYVAGGAVCTSMEEATLFLVAAARGVPCGSVLIAANNLDGSDPDEHDVYGADGSESRAIDVGIAAMRHIIAADARA